MAERVIYLQALRAGFACAVMVWAALSPQLVGPFGWVVAATLSYLLLAAASEWLRRVSGRRGLVVLAVMLLVDGAFLALAMYATGGAESPLRFLLYLHLIAVTLLASYRTGLKVTLWHSLLSFVALYAQAAKLIAPVDVLPANGAEGRLGFDRLSLVNLSAFWFVAIGTAAFSAVNERELRRRRANLESLVDVAADLEHTNGASEISTLLLDRASSEVGAKRGLVLAAPDGEEVSVMIGSGLDQPVPAAIRSDPLLHTAWSGGQTLLVKRLDAGVAPELEQLLPRARNVVICPLVVEQETLGALVLECGRHLGERIERRVLSVLDQLCILAALNLKNAALLADVRRLATTDPLTGLANRRVLKESLAREVTRARREGHELSVAMVDVDHFKRFNDTYGHQAGDEALRAVARVLAEGCRAYDLAARYGGEEFSIVLPNCSADVALEVVERMRNAIAALALAAPISASAGIASFPAAAPDAEALLKAADDALYRSKRRGRDQTTIYGGSLANGVTASL